MVKYLVSQSTFVLHAVFVEEEKMPLFWMESANMQIYFTPNHS